MNYLTPFGISGLSENAIDFWITKGYFAAPVSGPVPVSLTGEDKWEQSAVTAWADIDSEPRSVAEAYWLNEVEAARERKEEKGDWTP